MPRNRTLRVCMVLDRARTASPAFTVMATAQAASNMTARPAAAFRTEEDDSRSIAAYFRQCENRKVLPEHFLRQAAPFNE